MKILIVSTGSSCEPVVNAIKEYKPDYIYFLCSSGPKGSERVVDGPGRPCGNVHKIRCSSCGGEIEFGDVPREAIVTQVGLKPAQYEKILLEDPDDLNECYEKLSQLAVRLSRKHSGDLKVIGNFTGGTKSMSAALAMVGTMTEKWDISLNKGTRFDLVKVASGTDVPVVLDKWQVFCSMQVETVRDCLRRYDYAGADGILSQLSVRPLPGNLQSKIIKARQFCRAFDLWDRFDHKGALPLIETGGKEFAPYIVLLKKILGLIRSPTGYECVSDLLSNADRRAAQHHYDDAIARFYRAVELLAQIRLRTRPEKIDTGGLRLEQLPGPLQEEYRCRSGEDKRILLGLIEDYELLHKLGDPMGAVYVKQKAKVLDAIKLRNLSIGAHGLQPLNDKDYEDVSGVFMSFVTELTEAVGVTLEIRQLPTEELLSAAGLS